MSIAKKRYWSIVCYPESLPSDWFSILSDTGLPIAISPLHDSDVNEVDKELKKPHYHIILCYSGPTTFNVVKGISDKLNAPHPQYIESVRGAYRYLTHKDNPEKFQYKESDIQRLNGFNILDYADLTRSEAQKLKREALELITKNNIFEYSDLIDLLVSNDDFYDLFDYCSNQTVFFKGYLDSKRYKAEKALRVLDMHATVQGKGR